MKEMKAYPLVNSELSVVQAGTIFPYENILIHKEMQTLHTEIRIRASPEQVWKALVVSPAIPIQIRNAIRDRKTGVNLIVPMSAGGRSATLTVKLIAVDPFREIRWKGSLWIPWLFDGDHSFELREEGGTTMLVQREKFTGLFLPFLTRTISNTKQEFETMNAGIRDQAERTRA
jgi:hypothetical protein